MKKYSAAKDLLVLSYVYHKQGKKVQAAQLAIKAMEVEDSEELFETLDNENSEVEMEEDMENLTESDLEIPMMDDVEEADADEPEMEEFEDVELPPVEEAVAKVLKTKKIMANKMTLDGSKAAKALLVKKLLRK